MKKTNAHREGKFPFQAYLIPTENDIVHKVKQELGVKTNRELIVRLSRDYLSDIEQA